MFKTDNSQKLNIFLQILKISHIIFTFDIIFRDGFMSSH